MNRTLPLRGVVALGSCLLAALPILVFGLFLHGELTKRLIDEVSERNILLARSVQGQISTFLEQPVSALRHLSTYDMDHGGDAERGSDFSNELTVTVDSVECFEAIYLMNRDGLIEDVSFPDHRPVPRGEILDLDMSRQGFFIEPKRTGTVHWSSMGTSLVSGESALTISLPFKDRVLAGDINIRWLDRIVRDVEAAGNVEVMIVDKMGVLIRGRDDSLSDQRASLNHIPAVTEGLNGAEGTRQFELGGERRIGGFVHVPHAGWLLIVSQRTSEAFSSLQTLRDSLIAALLIVAVVAAVAGLLFATRVARPMSVLCRDARLIAGGAYDSVPAASRLREINALGTALSQMARRIRNREQALALSEQRHKDIVECTSDWFFEQDGDGHLTLLSDRFEWVMGESRDTFMGEAFRERLEVRRSLAGIRTINRAMADRRSYRNTELAFTLPDGKRRWILCSGNPVFTTGGRFAGYRGAASDITERRAIQEQIEWQQEVDRAISDLSRRLLTFSEYPVAELSKAIVDVGRRLTGSAHGFAGYIDTGTGHLVIPAMTYQAGWEGSDIPGDIVFRKFTGLWGWILNNKLPLITNDARSDIRSVKVPRHHVPIRRFIGAPAVFDGALVGEVVLANSNRDFLDRDLELVQRLADFFAIAVHRQRIEREVNEARVQAELSNAAKSVFLANMSHELRTPLNSIIGFADLMGLEMLGPLPDNYREYSGLIRTSGEHLLQIINDVLDMSKIEAGKIDMTFEETGVNDLLDEAMALLSAQARTNGVVMNREFGPECVIEADALRIKQCFLNVLSNAIKFSPQGEVTVTTRSLGDVHEIVVSDTGIGMLQKDIETALEPFGQVERQSTKRRYAGTGLGLPLAKKFIELHDGSLEIQSQLGHGTTVTLRLPVRHAWVEEPRIPEPATAMALS